MERAQQQLRDACVELALDPYKRATQQEIAEAARVSRMTVHRWASADAHDALRAK